MASGARSNGTSHKHEVPAQIPTSVPRVKGLIMNGWLFLTIIYFFMVYVLRDSASYLTPADEFCPQQQLQQNDSCSRGDLFAYQFAAFLFIVLCGLRGFWSWHVSRSAHVSLPSTPEGRLFGYLPVAEQLAAVSFSFQTWDLIISFTMEEHRTVIMLSHHFMAALVSWCSLDYQLLHHYGVFFLGLSELSSIFLVFVQTAKYFPPTPGSFNDFVVSICGPLFAVTFFWYRVVLWWKVSYRLWKDALVVLRSGMAEKLRPKRSFVLCIFLVLNPILGVLQLYWLGLILMEIPKVLGLEQELQ